MNKRRSLHWKMLSFIIPIIIIVFIGLITIITNKARVNMISNTKATTEAIAEKYANIISNQLSNDAYVTKGVAESMNSFSLYDNAEERLAVFEDIIERVVEENKNFVSFWVNLELKYIDSTYNKDHGRLSTTYIRYPNGSLKKEIRYLDMENPNPKSFYNRVKKTKKETIVEPTVFSYTGKKQDAILKTTYCVPLLIDNEFAGLVGVDLSLTRFEELIDQVETMNGGYAFLISNKGIIFTHPMQEMIGKPIKVTYPELEQKFAITQTILNGKLKSFKFFDKKTNKNSFYSFVPIYVGNSSTPWSIAFYTPFSEVNKQSKALITTSLLISLFGLVVLIATIFIVARRITNPLKKTTHVINTLAAGEVHAIETLNFKSKDEVEEMANSLNKLVHGLRETSQFAIEIGNGNLDATYHILGENDALGNSLLEMRQSLRDAKISERKRLEEDKKINWATQGEARFGELLRQYNADIIELSIQLLRYLIDYIGAVQGALYVKKTMDDEHQIFYELTGAVAYNREKLMETKFELGESLVGRCAYEKLTIYMEDVPDEYVKITSGMGEANPNTILLVPAKLNNETQAVIELVSFNKFENYQIQFVEKIGESIASTIQNVATAQRTQLLLEQSKQQAEEMAAQEEEMRQNLEELQATQEEVTRLSNEERKKTEEAMLQVEKRENTLQNVLNAIEYPIFIANASSEIILQNSLFEHLKITSDALVLDAENGTKINLSAALHAKTQAKGSMMINGKEYTCILNPCKLEHLDQMGIIGIIGA